MEGKLGDFHFMLSFNSEAVHRVMQFTLPDSDVTSN